MINNALLHKDLENHMLVKNSARKRNLFSDWIFGYENISWKVSVLWTFKTIQTLWL